MSKIFQSCVFGFESICKTVNFKGFFWIILIQTAKMIQINMRGWVQGVHIGEGLDQTIKCILSGNYGSSLLLHTTWWNFVVPHLIQHFFFFLHSYMYSILSRIGIEAGVVELVELVQQN